MVIKNGGSASFVDEEPTYVYDEKYILMNQGGFPEAHGIYLYLFNSYGYIIDSVIAYTRLPMPSIGDRVTYVNRERGEEYYGDGGELKIPARVITQAEYETWHEFDKA